MKKITLKFPANNFTDYRIPGKYKKVRAIKSRTVFEGQIHETLLEMRKEFVIAYAKGVMSYVTGSSQYIKSEINAKIDEFLNGMHPAGTSFIPPIIVWLAEGVTKENVSFHFSEGEEHFSEEILKPTYVIGRFAKVEAYFVIENVKKES